MARLNAQASRKLRETCDLTLTQWRIVLVIGTTSKITQAELSRITDVDKGQVSRAVRVLQDMGVVLASNDPTDQRMSWLKLTAQGQEIFDRTYPVMKERQASLMEDFSPDDAQKFFEGIEKINNAILADERRS